MVPGIALFRGEILADRGAFSLLYLSVPVHVEAIVSWWRDMHFLLAHLLVGRLSSITSCEDGLSLELGG